MLISCYHKAGILLLLCCLLLGHLGLYIFVAIWAIARPANNYYYVILY